MLVLARNENEAIIIKIGPIRIRLIVSRIENDRKQVKLAFDAPKVVNIIREEIEK